MKTKWLRIGLLSAAVFSGRVWADEQTFSVGNKAAPLTQEGGTARAMSMGSAYVGVAEGSETLFWNPAGLGDLCGKELGLHSTSSIGDTFQETGVFGMPIGSLGGIAASLNGVTNGSFEGRDQFGNQTANYSAGDIGANLGWGKKIVSGISIGAAIKTNQQYLAGSTYSSYATDLGLLWNPFSTFKVGAAYTNLNIGNSYSNYELNSAWNIGLSYYPIKPLLLAVAGQMQPGGVNRMQFGGEYSVNSIIELRGGYEFNYPNQDLSGMTDFTLGIGLTLTKHIQIDYAFVPEGALGEENRIGLIYKFGCEEKPAPMMKSEANIEPKTLAVVEAPVAVEEKVILLQDTHFDFDQSSLKPEAKTMLDTSIQTLKQNPGTFVRLAGYTSAEGTEEYNQKLSERRAASVRNYLIAGGIAPDRMTLIGYGEARPAEHEANPQDINSVAAKANMRTLFEIVIK